MGHTRQQYEDRIRARLGDLGVLQLVSEEQIPIALEEALLVYGNDHPERHTQTFTGDGATFDFDLTTDPDARFDTSWSRVIEVEWPTGQRVPRIIDSRRYTVRPNGVLRFLEDTPSTTQGIAVAHTRAYPFPDDDPTSDTVPDRHFPGVVAKAASILALNKGLQYARRQSSSVAGELIEHNPEPLFEAHRILKGIYEEAVLGRPAGPDAPGDSHMAVADVQPIFPDAIFHQRRRFGG